MEEQTLRYYLKVFSTSIIIFLFFITLFIFNSLNKELLFSKKSLTIKKGDKIEKILETNIENLFSTEIYFIKLYYKINVLFFNKFIHYGEFYIKNNISFIDLLKIISKPSNVLNKITIVEGWSQDQLNKELSKYFKDFYPIPYENIIADTYFFNKNYDFEKFVKYLYNIKEKNLKKYQNNNIYDSYTHDEILTIGSLIEKEGLDTQDKKIISSVIFNRIKKDMKLQIDASVLYAITNGKFNLNRKLLYNDLQFEHPYNTYLYKGIPPKPISYVGKKTIEIIFQNYKTDFLFYFFNKSLNRHVFSKNYEQHKKKLNEYRNK